MNFGTKHIFKRVQTENSIDPYGVKLKEAQRATRHKSIVANIFQLFATIVSKTNYVNRFEWNAFSLFFSFLFLGFVLFLFFLHFLVPKYFEFDTLR